MDISQLKRNQNILPNTVVEMGDALVAKKTCAIVLPFRFVQAKLLEIGKRIYIPTIFPLVDDSNQYAVINTCTKMEITCKDIEVIKHDGTDHYVFKFNKGDVICPDLNLVKDDTYSYLIFDELIQKAKAPWFLNYRDIGLVMSTAKEYAGVNLADTNAIFELIVASLSRSGVSNKYYREVITDLEESTLAKHPLESVPLDSITTAATNKMNKLMGGYIEDGLASALTEEKSSTSGVELLLRKQ